MKKLFATSLTAIVSTGIVLFACTPADEDTQTDTSVDSGATTDGAVDTADSGDSGEMSDAAATADASDSAAPIPTDIEVTVLSDNKPAAGATIIFADSTGAITSTMMTDANGKATKTIAGGETMTVVNGVIVADGGVGPSPDLVTVMGVKPGDKLVVPFYPFATTPPTVNTTLPPRVGSDAYSVQIGDSDKYDETTSIGVMLSNGASLPAPGAPFSVLALAYEGEAPIAGAYKKGQMLTPGANTLVDFVTGMQPASASWNTTLGTVSSVFTGADTLGDVYITGAVTMISEGMAFRTYQTDGTSTSTTHTMMNNTVSNFADSLQSMWFVADGGVRRVIKRFANTTTTMTTAASELLPEVTQSKPDMTNPVRPIYKWALSAPAPVDGIRLTVITPDPRDERWIEWRILVPSGATEVKLPEMPMGALGTEQLYLSDLVLVEGDFIANYDEFRKFGSAMATRDIDEMVGGSRATGTLRTTAVATAK